MTARCVRCATVLIVGNTVDRERYHCPKCAASRKIRRLERIKMKRTEDNIKCALNPNVSK